MSDRPILMADALVRGILSGKKRMTRRLVTWRDVEADAPFRAAVLATRGKRLGCPGCETGAPLCHSRVIAEWVEGQPR